MINKLTSLFKLTIHSPYLWILLASLLVLHTILFSHGLPHHGDLAYPYSADLYAARFFPTWNEHTSVTNLENLNRMFTFPLIVMALNWGGTETLAKLFFIVPLVLSGWSAALLIRCILREANPRQRPSTLVIVSASFIYMVNPWILEQVQAPFFWLAYAVTPAIILLTYQCFSKGRALLGVGSAILWSIASGSPHYAVFTGLTMFIVWGITFLFNRPTNVHALATQLKRYLKFGAIIAGFYAALNAYWVLPITFLLSKAPINPGYTFSMEMLDLFSRNSTILNVISGMDQWITWYSKASSLSFWVLLTLVSLPTFFTFALLRKKDNPRLFYILSFIWMIGTFFSLGGNNPLYRWLANEAPFATYYGWLLRVPGKISYLLWPAYAASAGLFLNYVYYNISQFSATKFLKLIYSQDVLQKGFTMIAIIAVLIPSMGFAAIKGLDYFNYYYAPVPIPEAYQQAFHYLESLQDSRVADLAPYDQGLEKNSLNFESSFTWNPDRISGYFVPGSIPIPSIGFYHFTYSSTWRPAYAKFSNPITQNATSWLAAYGVSHVLYHDDIVGTQDFAQRDLYTLNKTGFELIKQWDYVYLYKVPEPLGRIYALSNDFPDTSEIGKQICFDSFENETGCFSASLSSLEYYNRVCVTADSNMTTNHFLLITPLEGSGWTSIRSDTFYPKTDWIFVSVTIRQINAVQTHVVVRGFDSFLGEWVQITQVPSGQDGTFSWRTYNASVKIPGTIDGIQIELMGGWAPLNVTESEVGFDDIIVREILGPPTMSDIEASGVRWQEIKQIDATRWELKLMAEKPFKLVFTEGYDPYWVAKVQTNLAAVQIGSKKFLESINVFEINATGQISITLEYEPQKWFYYGSIISLSTFLICIAYLTYSYTKTKPIFQKLKQKLHQSNKSHF